MKTSNLAAAKLMIRRKCKALRACAEPQKPIVLKPELRGKIASEAYFS